MRRFVGLSRVVALLALFSLLLSACGGAAAPAAAGSTAAPAAKTVALVTDIGGVNDQSFNQAAYAGYTSAMNKYHFPAALIETKDVKDYTKNLTQAAQSSDLVIGVGFLMATTMDQVAKKFTTKKFVLIDSCAQDAKGNCETVPNVAPIFFKEEQAGCLVGAAAAQMELDGKAKAPKLLGHNTIASIGGLKIPPVDHYIAGYAFCAKKVDPAITVLNSYSQSFTDTAKCKDAAISDINQSQADIIFQVAGGCGVGALQAANDKGVYSIGVDSDQHGVNASVITSAIKKVDQSVINTIDTFEAGKYTNTPPTFDLTSDGVGYAPFSSDVPADVKVTVDGIASQIKAGTLTVPNTVP